MKQKIALFIITLMLMAACMPVTSADEIMARMEQAMDSQETIHQIQEMRMSYSEETTGSAGTDAYPGSMILEQWSQSRTMARVEQRTLDGELHNLTIVDGTQMIIYDVLANTYNEMTLPDMSDLENGSAFANAGTKMMIENMLAEFNFIFVGVENVADRSAFHLRSEIVDSDQGVNENTFSLPGMDTFELWIDSETYVVLGLEMQGEQFSMSQRTTFIDFNPQLSDELFVFTPPENAERMDMGDFSMPEIMTVDEAREAVDFPLLTPTFVPEGFVAENVYVMDATATQFFSDGEQMFSLIQMPLDGAMPVGINEESMRSITIRGQEATVQSNTFGSMGDVQLSWEENGVQIILGGIIEEIIQIAESLE